MMRSLFVGLALVGGLLHVATSATAQDLDPASVSRHYRFIPRVSRLIEIDPVSDPPIPWIVRGEFDFRAWPPHPAALVPAPHFANVEAWATHPHQDISVDLDDVVNLTGMLGRQLNASWPPPPQLVEIFQFKGDDGNGYPAEVFVARAGRWLYMRGQNRPAAAPHTDGPFRSAWVLKTLSRQTPFPDFDASDFVDAGDLNSWRTGFGDATTAAHGDADGDGDADGADFLSWQRDVGDSAPPLEFFDAAIDAAVASAAAPVPEPTTAALIALPLAALARRRRAGVCPQFRSAEIGA
jgi:hypothetical protein